MKTLALALCALTSSVAADVIVVDDTGATPGSFGTVQGAVDAALPGDTVLVVGSGLEVFQESVLVDGKGVTLISDTGVSTRLRSLRIANVPFDQRMVVRDVSAGLAGWNDQPDIALRVVNCAGSVRLEQSVFEGDFGYPGTVIPPGQAFDGAWGATITNCADVVATHCEFRGGGGANLFDEDFEQSATSGGHGVVVLASTVHFAGCDLIGAGGGSVFDTTLDSGGAGGSAVVNTGGVVSIAGGEAVGGNGGSGDCELFGCGSGGVGGDGVTQSGASPVLRVRDVTFDPGSGGFSGDGFPSADGIDVDLASGTQTSYAAAFRDFALTSPVRAGVDDVVLSFGGLSGDVAFVWPALDTAQAFLPKYQGPLLLNWTLGTGPILIGPLPPGAFDVALPVPALPGFDALDITIQAIFDDGAGALLAPAETLTVLG